MTPDGPERTGAERSLGGPQRKYFIRQEIWALPESRDTAGMGGGGE